MSTPTINDGGPAFPNIGSQEWPNMPGASLRDVFAGQMAAAIIAAGNANDQRTLTCKGGPLKLARAAYTIADAMIAARKEPIKP